MLAALPSFCVCELLVSFFLHQSRDDAFAQDSWQAAGWHFGELLSFYNEHS